MPYCHFELEPSHHRSESSVANSSDLASARVVEFEPCGVGLVSVRYYSTSIVATYISQPFITAGNSMPLIP